MADGFKPNPPSPDEVDQILAGYGVGAQRAAAPQDASNDILRQYGVTLKPGAVPPSDDASSRGLVVPAVKAAPGNTRGLTELEPAEYYTPQQVKEGNKRGIGAQFVSGIPIVGPAMNLLTATNGVPATPGAPNTFDQRFYDQQQADRAFSAQHPFLSTAAQLAGSALGYGGLARMVPQLMGLTGPTVAARIYQGVAGNAGLSAADALLRRENPLTAAEVGGISGVAAPIGGQASEGAINAAAHSLWPRPGPLSGVPRAGIDLLANALRGETSGTIAAATRRMGPSGVFADINPLTTDIAGAISDLPIAERGTIQNAYRARAASQPDRVDAALTRATGVPGGINIVQYHDWLEQQREASAAPLYDQWRNMSVEPTDNLTGNIIPRLEKAGALDEAQYLAGVTGQKIDRENMTPAQYDLVKRGLDSKIEDAFSGGNKTRARALVQLKNDLISEIGQTNAGQVWNQARQAFHERSNLMDQLQAGYETPLGGRSAQSVDEFSDEWNGLTGPEKVARIMGWRKMISEGMGESGNAAGNMRSKLLAPNNQAKLRIMLGPQADELIDTLKSEKDFSDRLPSIIPNYNTGASGQTRAERQKMFAPAENALASWVPELSLTNPLNLVPAAARPGAVAQDFASARAGSIPPSLVPILLASQQDVPSTAAAIMREGQRMTNVNRLASKLAGRPVHFAIAGPGQAEYRRQYQLSQPLAPP